MFVSKTTTTTTTTKPELSKEQREALSKSKRIANPGCYPTGFIGLTRPLVDAGILAPGTPVTVNAISGYSGGGKELMRIFETEDHEPWGGYGYALVRYRNTMNGKPFRRWAVGQSRCIRSPKGLYYFWLLFFSETNLFLVPY